MGPMILALLGSLGSVFGGIFTAKANTVGSVTDMVGKIADADAASDMARALPIMAEANSGSWLAANWRPLTMMIFVAIIVSRWFGYMPPNMTAEEFSHVWYLVTCGLCGYGAQRTIEKVVDKVNLARVVGAYMGKSYNNVIKDDDNGR